MGIFPNRVAKSWRRSAVTNAAAWGTRGRTLLCFLSQLFSKYLWFILLSVISDHSTVRTLRYVCLWITSIYSMFKPSEHRSTTDLNVQFQKPVAGLSQYRPNTFELRGGWRRKWRPCWRNPQFVSYSSPSWCPKERVGTETPEVGSTNFTQPFNCWTVGLQFYITVYRQHPHFPRWWKPEEECFNATASWY